jgi:coiled-coil domain-containing protein 12
MPAMKFRNYLPHDEQLRGGKVAPVSLPKFEDPISAETTEPKQVEVLVLWYYLYKHTYQMPYIATILSTLFILVQNPFGNIAPKNPNWDLKRDVQKRMDKLEKRTQKALAEIALEQQKEKEALGEGSDAAQD